MVSPDRQQMWTDVEARLAYSGRHTKRDLQQFKRYFMEQKEPLKGYDDPIPLLYRLWWCPDPSDAAWEALLQELMLGDPRRAQLSLKDSCDILLQEAGSSRYNGVDGAPLGFMGGMEERLLRFFRAHTDSEGAPILKRGNLGFAYYHHLLCWLEDNNRNPYQLTQYWTPEWFEALGTEAHMREIDADVRTKFTVKKLFEAIRSLATAAEAPAVVTNYAQRVVAFLDTADLKDPVRKLWRQVGGQVAA